MRTKRKGLKKSHNTVCDVSAASPMFYGTHVGNLEAGFVIRNRNSLVLMTRKSEKKSQKGPCSMITFLKKNSAFKVKTPPKNTA